MACRGAAFIDLVLFAPSAAMQGGPRLADLKLAGAVSQDAAALAPKARIVLRAASDRASTLNAFAPRGRTLPGGLALWPEDVRP